MRKFKPFKLPEYTPQVPPKIIKRPYAQTQLEEYLKAHRSEIGQVLADVKAGKYKKDE